MAPGHAPAQKGFVMKIAVNGDNVSTPTGGNAFLHELELTVRTELTLAQTGQPYEEAVAVPIDEWLSDPADAQRYEIGLRSLLGAVEALEGPGDHPWPAEVPGSVGTARYSPSGPDRLIRTEGW
jgi:hypothetical protein